jgi:hypothetical protein
VKIQAEGDAPTNSGMDILSLEEAILAGQLENGRDRFREMLLQMTSLESGSIGDALAVLAKHPLTHRAGAILLLRCLAIRGLLPEPNSTNQLVRSTVELCDGAIPEIVSFLKINARDQNIDKFEFQIYLVRWRSPTATLRQCLILERRYWDR